MLQCDIVIALFFDRVGQFTLEEFETARNSLNDNGNIKYLYVYFKTAKINIDEVDLDEIKKIREFKKKIEKYNQMYCSYSTIEGLKLQLRQQLDLIIPRSLPEKNNNKTTKSNNGIQISEPHINDYLTQCLQDHRHLNMHGFETTLRIPIELERVYVHMKAHINTGIHHEYGMDCQRDREIDQVDIRRALIASERLNVKDIIILGGPGSGKTTLLKYILIMVVEKRATEKLGLSENFIPFFVPLRDLRDPDKEMFESANVVNKQLMKNM